MSLTASHNDHNFLRFVKTILWLLLRSAHVPIFCFFCEAWSVTDFTVFKTDTSLVFLLYIFLWIIVWPFKSFKLKPVLKTGRRDTFEMNGLKLCVIYFVCQATTCGSSVYAHNWPHHPHCCPSTPGPATTISLWTPSAGLSLIYIKTMLLSFM